MKRLFGLLCGLTLFFSTYAQDSLVHIKPSTARYYLEVEDKMYLFQEKDSISNELIYNLSSEIHLKDLIIQSFQSDTLIHNAREKALKENIQWVERDLNSAEKEIKRQKKIKWGIMGLAVALLLLLN